MGKQEQKVLAIFLIAIGFILLAARLIHIDPHSLFWPLLLISLGLVFIFRPQSLSTAGPTTLKFVGEISRYGAWQLADEQILGFVNELDLDLTQAAIPAGETNLRLLAFVNEVILRVPADLGLSVHASAFVTEANISGEPQQYILTGLNYVSPNFAAAASKLRLEVNSFVADIKIRPA